MKRDVITQEAAETEFRILLESVVSKERVLLFNATIENKPGMLSEDMVKVLSNPSLTLSQHAASAASAAKILNECLEQICTFITNENAPVDISRKIMELCMLSEVLHGMIVQDLILPLIDDKE